MDDKVINLEGREPSAEEMKGLVVCMAVAKTMNARSVVILAEIGGEIIVRTMLHPDSPESISEIADAMEDSAKKIRDAIPKVSDVINQVEAKKAADRGELH